VDPDEETKIIDLEALGLQASDLMDTQAQPEETPVDTVDQAASPSAQTLVQAPIPEPQAQESGINTGETAVISTPLASDESVPPPEVPVESTPELDTVSDSAPAEAQEITPKAEEIPAAEVKDPPEKAVAKKRADAFASLGVKSQPKPKKEKKEDEEEEPPPMPFWLKVVLIILGVAIAWAAIIVGILLGISK
jgi:hypothetical protein